MTPEEFMKQAYENDEHDADYYGIMPPPTNAQHGLNILIEHFLGEDWYTTCSIHNEQVNTEAICEILKKYPVNRERYKQIVSDMELVAKKFAESVLNKK